MINSTVSFTSFILFLGLLMTSCEDHAFYDEAHSFDKNTWTEKDTAVFKVEVDDTDINYDFFLTLRTSKSYAYSNLWVTIETIAPDDSKSVISQRIDIANPDGSWKGRVTGSLVENRLHYRTTAFPLEGNYTFRIYQSVNQEKINDVMDISLRIEPKFVNS